MRCFTYLLMSKASASAIGATSGLLSSSRTMCAYSNANSRIYLVQCNCSVPARASATELTHNATHSLLLRSLSAFRKTFVLFLLIFSSHRCQFAYEFKGAASSPACPPLTRICVLCGDVNSYYQYLFADFRWAGLCLCFVHRCGNDWRSLWLLW